MSLTEPHAELAVDHRAIIEVWIAAANSMDVNRYLRLFTADAVLDDPSVGRQYVGPGEIAEYFRTYFVGYRTRTRLLRTETRDGLVHVEVDFTGDFPGTQTGGMFDVALAGDLIAHVTADLV